MLAATAWVTLAATCTPTTFVNPVPVPPVAVNVVPDKLKPLPTEISPIAVPVLGLPNSLLTPLATWILP